MSVNRTSGTSGIVGNVLTVAALTLLSATAAAQRGGGAGGGAMDSRAEARTYSFAETTEDMSYCVFASSKIDADTPAPLIVTLHGLGAGPEFMCDATAIDLAEEGGYILVAPMGYNTSGWSRASSRPRPHSAWITGSSRRASSSPLRSRNASWTTVARLMW
jgi:poly(3-hydroxybutyrate) depolymerase